MNEGLIIYPLAIYFVGVVMYGINCICEEFEENYFGLEASIRKKYPLSLFILCSLTALTNGVVRGILWPIDIIARYLALN